MARRNNKKIKKSNSVIMAGYMLLSLVLIGSISLLFSLRVESKTQAAILFDNEPYEEAEQDYKKFVSGVLENHECYNSGLNLTRRVELSGEREYYMEIYNHKFAILSQEEMEEIRQEIEGLTIMGPGGISHNVEVSMFG